MRQFSLLMVFAIFAIFAKTSDAWDFFGFFKPTDPVFDNEQHLKDDNDYRDVVNFDIEHPEEEKKFQINLMAPMRELSNCFDKFVESLDFFGILDDDEDYDDANNDKTKAPNATIRNQINNGATNTSLIVKKPQTSNSTISPSNNNNNNNTISKDNKH